MGVGAAIYTQWNDVETEVNGLLTYDRALEGGGGGRIRHAFKGGTELSPALKHSMAKFAARAGHMKLPLEFFQEFSARVMAAFQHCGPTEGQSLSKGLSLQGGRMKEWAAH